MAVNDYGAFPRHQDLADLGVGDPHPQYVFSGVGLLAARPPAGRAGRIYYATDTDLAYIDDGTAWVNFGNNDHGLLTGLTDDDHPQYLNNARGDARYLGLNAGDTRYLGLTAKAADSNLLDGLDSAAFARLTGATFTGAISATSVSDSGNRVYSASNPPPAGSQLAVGTYTGDGTDPRTISVGFTPKFVTLVMGPIPSVNGLGGYWTTGPAGISASANSTTVGKSTDTAVTSRPQIVTGGFQVGGSANTNTNYTNGPFTYYAWS